jgi:hypothetical protein
MALGCIPSHASYFLAYEHLKTIFDVQNGEFNLISNLCIGATTTFAHDFFITPSDGKFIFQSNFT